MSERSTVVGAYETLGIAGRLALLLVAAGLAFAGWTSLPLLRSLGAASARERVAPDAPDRSRQADARVEAFAGRSLFFIPARPAPPRPVVEDRPPPGDPAPPPPPSRYAGPAVIAMVNDTVWFADGRRLTVGGEGERGLRVVRVEAPWRAVVEWSGVEFTVGLFEQDKVVLPRSSSESPSRASADSEVKP